MKRAAVFFHYYELNDEYADNLIFFISVAYKINLDYYIIISGKCSVELPEIGNVNYIHVENKNNDYGGYVSALSLLGMGIKNYEYFIFINSSVRGPFTSLNSVFVWEDVFLSMMTDDVHLVGSSICIPPQSSPNASQYQKYYGNLQSYAHVQTTAYALTLTALEYLLENGFYQISESMTKRDVISRYELHLSQVIIRAGWNIRALLSKYNDIDYRKEHGDINYTSRQGDPLFRGGYFGKTVKLSEVVFIKTNRHLKSSLYMNWRTLWTLIFVRSPEIKKWSEYKKLKKRCYINILLFPVSILNNAYHMFKKKNK